MAPTAITAQQAAAVLGDLREARDTVSTRAAGLSLMVWALVVTSTAGSLIMLTFAWKSANSDLVDSVWLLFLAAEILTIAVWLALGGFMQNAIWQAFGILRPAGVSAWRAPLTALGVALFLVALNLPMHELTLSLQGLNDVPIDGTEMAQINWNAGFSLAMVIGGAIVVAVTLLMAARGFPRASGIAVGLGMMVFGHLATFLWFPNLGVAGPLVAVAFVPTMFLGLGSYLFRQG